MAYSPSLFDVLLGIEQAIEESGSNIGRYISEKEKAGLELAKQIEEANQLKGKEEKQRRAEEAYRIKLLKLEDKQLKDQENKFTKSIPFFNREIKERRKEIREEIQSYAVNEQNRLIKNEEDTLASRITSNDKSKEKHKKAPESELSDSAREQKRLWELIYDLPSTEEESSNLSEIEKEKGDQLLSWMTGGRGTDFLKSIPSAWLEAGEGLSGLLGAKDLKQKIREGKQAYEEKVGIADRDALNAQAGRLAGDIINPLGLIGKALKLPKLISKVPSFLKHLGSGSLYGAIQAEKDDEDPLTGAAIGAGASAILQGVGKGLSQAKKGKFEKIKKGATFTEPQEILQRTEVMGKGVTIPELVGDETLINKIKKDNSVFNKNRMGKIERNIKENAKKQMGELPKGEEELMELYGNLKDVRKEAGEATASLYDVVKESGIGSEGLLEKPMLKEWIQAIKRSQGEIKGLPKMKPNGAHIKDIEKLLMIAPDDPKAYRAFYIQNANHLPTAGDFLKYRSKVKNMLEKSGSAEVEGLTNLSENIERIIEGVDTTSSLAKANKAYKTKIAPLNQKDVKSAMTAASFAESKEGRPKISKVFGEQSNENNLVFKQLPTEDKKRVIGAFLEENLKNEKNPARAMLETWKKLPDYIKLTDDPEIKKIIEGMHSLSQVNQTLSSMQRSTTTDIGSRQAIDKAMKIGKWLGYGGSIFVNPTLTAGLGLVEGLAKGGMAARHALLRKGVGQKQLKHYLKPELLDELYSRKISHLQKPIIKIQEQNKKKRENYDNKRYRRDQYQRSQ